MVQAPVLLSRGSGTLSCLGARGLPAARGASTGSPVSGIRYLILSRDTLIWMGVTVPLSWPWEGLPQARTGYSPTPSRTWNRTLDRTRGYPSRGMGQKAKEKSQTPERTWDQRLGDTLPPLLTKTCEKITFPHPSGVVGKTSIEIIRKPHLTLFSLFLFFIFILPCPVSSTST